MSDAVQTESERYKLLAGPEGAIGIQFSGRIDHLTAAPLRQHLMAEIIALHPSRVTVDLQRVAYFDDFGVLILAELRQHLSGRNIPFRIVQPPPRYRRS